MSKSLVIVESPAKAKTINKYLGSDYIVEASVGHVKDLPRGDLSIDIEGGFVPTYEVIKGKQDVIQRLKNLAARCDDIYLATDPDREGEAIAHHIAEEISAPKKRIRRVLFNEITRQGITTAMRQPRAIDAQMVAAQEARRVMDRLIGYKISPFLWRTFVGEAKGLSAGRVQSVALRLVVERERAINSFIPIEYWSLLGHFRTRGGDEIVARLVRYAGNDIRNPSGSALDLKEEDKAKFIATKADAERLRDRALREEYRIVSIVKKEVRRAAAPPFTTSTLQQDAGRRLRFNTKKTMQIAQKLYEGVELGRSGLVGLITYMRTDSTRVSDEAASAAEQFIYENYGKEYLPKSARKAVARPTKGDSKVQDAHEAIRPTDVKITPKEAAKHLEKDQAALYELIWSRFVASQMADALFDQTTLDIEGGPCLFRATGRITKFKGWMQVYAEAGDDGDDAKEGKDDDRSVSAGRAGSKRSKAKSGDGENEERESDRILPEVKKGEELKLESIDLKQSFTKPPARYTESLLVKEMEAKGIGRPSTYSSIISTIQERGYVEQKERRLYATDLGMRVCDVLVNGFPALFDMKFTARMEEQLDTIAGGNATYLDVMRRFYRPLSSALRSSGALSSGKSGSSRPALKRGTGESRAPRLKGKKSDVVCDKCGSPMVRRSGKNGEFYGCSNYPTCRNTRPVPLGITCPLCGQGDIVQRVGGRYQSVFYGCTRYPDCRFTSGLKPVNKPCSRCGNSWLTEAWSETEGDFLECPKCKAKSGR